MIGFVSCLATVPSQTPSGSSHRRNRNSSTRRGSPAEKCSQGRRREPAECSLTARFADGSLWPAAPWNAKLTPQRPDGRNQGKKTGGSGSCLARSGFQPDHDGSPLTAMPTELQAAPGAAIRYRSDGGCRVHSKAQSRHYRFSFVAVLRRVTT